MTELFYAGVGSRETPEQIQMLMQMEVARLAGLGYTVRTGGADGADNAFEVAAKASDRPCQVYLPWRGFNGRSGAVRGNFVAAEAMAAKVHPGWSFLSQGARKLHARNCFQILGEQLNRPVSFVLCWTKDGAQNESETNGKTGGTRTAIVLADRLGIPVINMANEGWQGRLLNVLDDVAQREYPLHVDVSLAGVPRATPSPKPVVSGSMLSPAEIVAERAENLKIALSCSAHLSFEDARFVTSYKHLVEGGFGRSADESRLIHLTVAQGNYLAVVGRKAKAILAQQRRDSVRYAAEAELGRTRAERFNMRQAA